MRRRSFEYILFTVVATAFLLASFTAGYFTREIAGSISALRLNAPLLAEARNALSDYYLGPLPSDTELEYGMIRGMLESVGDPYTVFVEPVGTQMETAQLAGQFGGVGVTLAWNDEKAVALDVIPGGPAEQGGIVEGDILLKVDDRDIPPGSSLDEVATLLRGPLESKVTLTIRHKDNGEMLTVTLPRIQYEIPSVTWRVLDEHPEVGLMVVTRFSEKTPEEITEALNDLKGRGAAKFILDLRNNGGGLLDAGVQSAGLFLNGGVVMYEQKRGTPEETFEAKPQPVGAGIPLVVLVNGGTASASEVVAGALAQNGRAPLIGQKTYGKGSVQSIVELSDGSSLHVTSARWYTPARTPLDGNGLTPTLEVQPASDGSDAELARAIEYFISGN